MNAVTGSKQTNPNAHTEQVFAHYERPAIFVIRFQIGKGDWQVRFAVTVLHRSIPPSSVPVIVENGTDGTDGMGFL